MCAKNSMTAATSNMEGEFLHELEDKLEVSPSLFRAKKTRQFHASVVKVFPTPHRELKTIRFSLFSPRWFHGPNILEFFYKLSRISR